MTAIDDLDDDEVSRWNKFSAIEVLVIQEALGCLSDNERQSPYWADEADRLLTDMPDVPEDIKKQSLAMLNREKNT